MLSWHHADFNVYIKERKIVIQVDKVVLGEESKIDGCYVLTTHLKKEVSKEKNTLYHIQFM